MAIAYDGINYFPVGVNFMEENAMEVIEAKYGIKGSAIVLKLMCKIYKEGYYIRWDEEQCLIFANKAGREVQAEEVQGIIEILFTKGILDRNSYQENGILTSESIQKVWMEATKRRKRELSELPYLMVKLEKENGKADTPPALQEIQQPELFKKEKTPVNPKNVVHHVAVDARATTPPFCCAIRAMDSTPKRRGCSSATIANSKIKCPQRCGHFLWLDMALGRWAPARARKFGK